jgi:hypothetical protein
MSTLISRSVFPVVLAFSLLGCGAPGDPELTCDTTTSSATLASSVQQQVISPACATCHSANYQYGDYTSATATAAATVNVKSLYAGTAGTLKVVEPGNLANSALWLKVLGGTAKARTGPKGENVFGAMPNDGTTLSPTQKQALKDWICSGAK